MKKLLVGYSSPFKKNSPLKNPLALAAISAIPGIITAAGSLLGRKKRAQEQETAKAELEKAKQDYMGMEFKNYYADMKNPYAENLYEDGQVDTASADYMKKQSEQGLANIGQTLKGAAGTSGVAGLAQTMANMSTQNAKKASLSIQEQERSNRKLALEGEALKQKGAAQVDLYKRKGEASKDAKEQARTETMYELGLDRSMAADRARMAARQQGVEGLGMAVQGAAAGYYAGSGDNETVADPNSEVTNEDPNSTNAQNSGNNGYTMMEQHAGDPYQYRKDASGNYQYKGPNDADWKSHEIGSSGDNAIRARYE